MTTSPETEWMNHPALRKLVTAANELSVRERMTLVKGLLPSIAAELDEREFDEFATELRLKGERYLEARAQQGKGRKDRTVPGERDIEGR